MNDSGLLKICTKFMNHRWLFFQPATIIQMQNQVFLKLILTFMIYSQSKLLDEKSISQYESFLTVKKNRSLIAIIFVNWDIARSKTAIIPYMVMRKCTISLSVKMIAIKLFYLYPHFRPCRTRSLTLKHSQTISLADKKFSYLKWFTHL